jgi:signal transduction histidine kinase
MLMTVALIAALAFWDAERQSEAALEDFAQEQASLASSVAVRARFRAVLGVLLASGLVLVFGGVALLLQRKELQMEQELAIADLRRKRDEKLVRANKAATLGTLALGIAHELSTPLGVITVRTEQLKNRLSQDERADRSLQSILEQANHISQTIRGLLSLCRGDHPPTEPLSPIAVVSGAVALCEHRFAKANVKLTVTPATADVPSIRGDKRLLEQALVNLLLNACDACNEGGRVDVRITKENDHIIFSVRDNGIGISAAHAERVLEPFFTTKPAEQGSGLSLAIAGEIVKHHRGELRLEPEASGGTRATIEIPVWPAEAHLESDFRL